MGSRTAHPELTAATVPSRRAFSHAAGEPKADHTATFPTREPKADHSIRTTAPNPGRVDG
jgi:hypothetical protein